MNKEQLLELINKKIAGQGSAVDIGGALAPVLTELVNNLEEVAQKGCGITVALNPPSSDNACIIDAVKLSQQLNYWFNTDDFIDLRKYFFCLIGEVEPDSENSISLHLAYTWDVDDFSYFGASVGIAIEEGPETDYVLVVGEFLLDSDTNKYTDDFETIIEPELRRLLEQIPASKIMNGNV